MPLAHHLSWTPGPAINGRHARGFVYEVLRSVDDTIHDQNSPGGFSVCVQPGGLRINTLTAALDEDVAATCQRLVGETIRLGTHRLDVHSVRAEGHPITLATSYAKFLQADPHVDCTLRFASPTFFRRAGANYSLPEPALVFGSIIARWNAYAPVKVPERAELELKGATVRHFDIQTKPITFETHAVGVVGTVTYHFAGASEETLRWSQALGQFAYFSGVGAKTSMGLGEIRPVDPAEFKDAPRRTPRRTGHVRSAQPGR